MFLVWVVKIFQLAIAAQQEEIINSDEKYVEAVKRQDADALHQLNGTQITNLSEKFYIEAFKACKHIRYESDFCKAVIEAVISNDFMSHLVESAECADKQNIVPDVEEDSELIIDGLMASSGMRMIGKLLKKSEQNTVEGEARLQDPDTSVWFNDTIKTAVFLKGFDESYREAVLDFLIPAIGYLTEYNLKTNVSNFLTNAVCKCHGLLQKLCLMGNCCVVVFLIHQSTAYLLRVGPINLRFERRRKQFKSQDQKSPMGTEYSTVDVDIQALDIPKAGETLIFSIQDADYFMLSFQ